MCRQICELHWLIHVKFTTSAGIALGYVTGTFRIRLAHLLCCCLFAPKGSGIVTWLLAVAMNILEWKPQVISIASSLALTAVEQMPRLDEKLIHVYASRVA